MNNNKASDPPSLLLFMALTSPPHPTPPSPDTKALSFDLLALSYTPVGHPSPSTSVSQGEGEGGKERQ